MRWNVPHDGEWHHWFAWFPVRCSQTNVSIWLEVVDRRFYTLRRGGMVHKEHRVKQQEADDA